MGPQLPVQTEAPRAENAAGRVRLLQSEVLKNNRGHLLCVRECCWGSAAPAWAVEGGRRDHVLPGTGARPRELDLVGKRV